MCEHLPAYGFCSISYLGSSENEDEDDEEDDAFKREGGDTFWLTAEPSSWLGGADLWLLARHITQDGGAVISWLHVGVGGDVVAIFILVNT